MNSQKPEDRAVPEKVLIRGLVIPSNWNEAGKVIGVSIKTFDEDSFRVSDRTALRKLLKFICREVSLKGVVRFNRHGKTISLCDRDIVAHEFDQVA